MTQNRTIRPHITNNNNYKQHNKRWELSLHINKPSCVPGFIAIIKQIHQVIRMPTNIQKLHCGFYTFITGNKGQFLMTYLSMSRCDFCLYHTSFKTSLTIDSLKCIHESLCSHHNSSSSLCSITSHRHLYAVITRHLHFFAVIFIVGTPIFYKIPQQ